VGRVATQRKVTAPVVAAVLVGAVTLGLVIWRRRH
jgi:hypothetical protein